MSPAAGGAGGGGNGGSGPKLRIGIVNDLRLAVEALKRVVAVADGEVAWVAEDGAQALERCLRDRPDLVLMDIVMPVMDGVAATRRIMKEAPCPILVVTSTMEGNLERVWNALGAGALDAVQGPVFGANGTLDGAQPVVRKIRTMARLRSLGALGHGGGLGGSGGAHSPASPPPAAPPRSPAVLAAGESPLLVLGASTGGPEALVIVLRGLPRELAASIVVVQHLDAEFVPGLVGWMSAQTGRRVHAIAPGDRPEPREVFVACTNDHLLLGADGRFGYRAEPVEQPFRPSVDVFFASLVAAGVRAGVAALLTGMGRDGAEGLLALKRAGWRTFAQDEATSVVFGMPRAAHEVGAAEEMLAVGAMGGALAAAWHRQAAAPRAPLHGRS